MSIVTQVKTFVWTLISGNKRKSESFETYDFTFEGHCYSVTAEPVIRVRRLMEIIQRKLKITTGLYLKLYKADDKSSKRVILNPSSTIRIQDLELPFIAETISSFSLISGMAQRVLDGSPTIQLDVIDGMEFPFVDREESVLALIEYIRARLGTNSSEAELIAVLDHGPGAGKSRFLQEIPDMLRNLDLKDLKEILSKAVYINTAFNSCWAYSTEEVTDGIEHALCLRIMHQYLKDHSKSFCEFKEYCKPLKFKLAEIIHALSIKGVKCLLLAIDEVNKIYDANQTEFTRLFAVISNLCSSHSLLFLPILAGTVIGPIRQALVELNLERLSIPLPPIQYENSLMIIQNAMKLRNPHNHMNIPSFVSGSYELKRLALQTSGHCRSLDHLLLCLQTTRKDEPGIYWKTVREKLIVEINRRYNISYLPMAGAIAYFYLGISAEESDSLPENSSQTFLNLVESGVCTLKNGSVFVPFLFIASFMETVGTSQAYFSTFWKNMSRDSSNGPDFFLSHVTFRIACYSFLRSKSAQDYNTVSLKVILKDIFPSYDVVPDILVTIPEEPCIKETQTFERKKTLIGSFISATCSFLLSTNLGNYTVISLITEEGKSIVRCHCLT
jgi:hypothetical protein